MGTMVIGLFTQTKSIESKMFAENITARTAPNTVCPGIGRKAQNNPIAKALAIVLLFHFHNSGSAKCLLSQPKLTFSRFGLYFFNVSFIYF